MSASNDNSVLRQLGYKNTYLIDAGNFGRVYKVNKPDGKIVCVKVIPLDKFKDAEYDSSEKLEKIEENDNVLICSNIRKIEDEKVVTLEMDFMNGGDLKNYIDEYSNYFSEKQIFEMVKQIGMMLIQ
jgi:serine/threonine protein kinase